MTLKPLPYYVIEHRDTATGTLLTQFCVPHAVTAFTYSYFPETKPRSYYETVYQPLEKTKVPESAA